MKPKDILTRSYGDKSGDDIDEYDLDAFDNNQSYVFEDLNFNPFDEKKIDVPIWEDAIEKFEIVSSFYKEESQLNALMILWLAYQHGYYREINDFKLFIHPRIKNSSVRIDLVSQLQKEINETNNRSWLIEAGAGMGKTTLCQYLCQEAWESFFEGEEEGIEKRIPIYIHLPSIDKNKREESLLDDALLKVTELLDQSIITDLSKILAKEKQWVKKQRLLLFLDGYDEISERKNFYISNKWGDQHKHFDIKIVYGCRPEALNNIVKTPKELFGAEIGVGLDKYISLKTHTLIKLEKDQKNAYLLAYIVHHKLKTRIACYKYWIKSLPGISEVIENPQLLRLVVDVLPQMVKKAQRLMEKEQVNVAGEASKQHYTRWFIYETFVWEWIKGQAKRIRHGNHTDEGGELYGLAGSLEDYLFSYVSNLASELWRENHGRVDTALLPEDKTLKTVLMEPRLRKSVVATSEEEKKNHESYKTLLKAYKNKNESYSDHAFFSGEIEYDRIRRVWVDVKKKAEILQLKDKRLKIIRSGSLLKVYGQNYKFLHKTVIEYLTMERMTYDLRTSHPPSTNATPSSYNSQQFLY